MKTITIVAIDYTTDYGRHVQGPDGEPGPRDGEYVPKPMAAELVAALIEIAELDGDSEQQKFRLTRFQASQVARKALAKACLKHGSLPAVVAEAAGQKGEMP